MLFSFRKSIPLKKLEEKLKTCLDESLPEEQKTGMKARIMRSLVPQKLLSESHGFEALIFKIREISRGLEPSAIFRTILKEKLVTVVEFYAVRNFRRFPNWFSGHRKLVASLTIFVLVFGTLFNFVFKIPKAEASFRTSLEETLGEVWVIRDGALIAGKSNLLLKADDTIRTGEASRAEIRFLDQSVGRMAENTEVKIAKLFVNPSNKTQTVVEVILNEGRLWSRVVNLIDNFSRFQVKTTNTTTVAKKKAAFDISTSQGKATKVTAMQHRVNIVVATDKKVTETTLTKGFSAEVKSGTQLPLPQIKSESASTKDQWTTENLAQDKQYVETIKQEAQAQSQGIVQVLPGSPFYAMKELTENTKIALTFDDVERQKKKILAASEKLAEALLFLERGQLEGARSILMAFQSLIAETSQWLKDRAPTNPAETAEVKRALEEALSFYEKNLNLVLPDDPAYEAKTALAEAKLSTAPNATEHTQEKIAQAGQKLLEAQDLVEQGNTAAATQQIEAYKEGISTVAEEVKQLPADEKVAAVGALLDNKAEDLKTLAAITTSVSAIAQSPIGSSSAPVAPFSDAVSAVPAFSEILVTATSTPAIETGTSVPSILAPPAVAAETVSTAVQQELQKAVSEAKTESLEKISEAVFDVQKEQSSNDVLRKIEDLKKADMNGKPLVNVTITPNRVTITSPPTANLGMPVSPQAPQQKSQ